MPGIPRGQCYGEVTLVRLCSVSIRNFRAIRDLDDLRIHDFSVLVGKNDAGKSTVLAALQRFFEGKGVPEDFCTVGECATAFWVQAAFDNLPAELSVRLAAERALDAEGRLTLRRVFSKGTEGKPQQFLVVCEDFVHEDFRNLPGRKDGELNTLISKYKLTEIGQSGSGRTNEKRWTVLWDFAERENYEREPAQLREPHAESATLLTKCMPSYHLFPSTQGMDTTAAAFQGEFVTMIAEAVKDMPEVQSLQTAGKQAVAQEVKAIEAILLDQTNQITALEAEIDFEPKKAATVVLHVSDAANVRNPLSSRGLGIQRLAVIAFLKRQQARKAQGKNGGDPSVPSRRVIYAIEEPETFLHPAAQRDFYYSLRSLSQGASPYQIVATTHSTVFVDRMHPHELALLVRDGTGITSARQVTEDDLEESIRRELGLRNSDYFFANCLLCFEGETEQEALPVIGETCLNATLDERGIMPVCIRGKDNFPFFLKAANVIGVPVVLMADGDAEEQTRAVRPSDLVRQGLLGEDDVFVYAKGDFEYQFSDETLSEAMNIVLSEWGYVVDVEAIAEVRASQADGRMGIALGSYAWNQFQVRYAKPDLGAAIASLRERAGIPVVMGRALVRAESYTR